MKKITLATITLGIFSLVLILIDQKNNFENEREAYAEYITNHPYANRSFETDDLKSIPKFDRPDLAAEHNFLQVVDPKLGRIPTERLATSYETTKKRLNERFGKNKTKLEFNEFRRIDHSLKEDNDQTTKNIRRAAIPDVNWVERGPNNVGGRTRALMWDPNDQDGTKVWAGATSGGIWFNNDITDANSAWVPVNDFLSSLAIASITYDPNNTDIFYAGTGEGFIAGSGGGGVAGAGLYKSIDGGSNWTLVESTIGPDFRYIQKVVVTSSSTVLITTRESRNEGGSGGVFRSTNGGDSWTRVIDDRGADLQLASNGDIYASTGLGFGTGRVWQSTDD
ncbi:MAG: sialidase family protein, partial [Bacteroidota bacterium]